MQRASRQVREWGWGGALTRKERKEQEREPGRREGTGRRARAEEGTRWWLCHGAPTESIAGSTLVGGVWATSSGLCGVGTRGLR